MEKDLTSRLQEVQLHLLPSSLVIGFCDATKNYLVAQKIFLPQSLIQMLSIFVELTFQYLFIVYLDLGLFGIGLARFLDELGKFSLLCFYVRYSKKCQETTIPWSKECLKGLWKQFREQLSAGGLFILDVFGGEIVLMQAAYMNEVQQTASIVAQTIVSLCLIMTVSLQIALSAFIGNCVGEQNELKLKKYIKAGMLIDVFLICLTWGFVGTLGEKIAHSFSSHSEVIHVVQGLIGIYMLIIPVDNLQMILGGVLRAVGKGESVSRLFLIITYPLSISLSLLLTLYYRCEIYGLYMTIFVVKGINAIAMTYMLKRVNIKEQIERAIATLKVNEKSMIGAKSECESREQVDEVPIESFEDDKL